MGDERNKRLMYDVCQLLAEENIKVTVDPKLDDNVMLPLHIQNDAKPTITFGFDMKPTQADLMVTEVGISATLKFGGDPFECFVPWEAVTLVEGCTSGSIVGGKKKRAPAKKKIAPATGGDNVVSLDEYKRKNGIP